MKKPVHKEGIELKDLAARVEALDELEGDPSNTARLVLMGGAPMLRET